MRAAFGVCHHTVMVVHKLLIDSDPKRRFRLNKVNNGKLREPTGAGVTIFFMQEPYFREYLDILNSNNKFKDVIVFVFGGILALRQYQRMKVLDADLTLQQFVTWKPLVAASLINSIDSAMKSREYTVVEWKKSEYLKELITTVKEGSMLGPLMACLYKLPVREQKQVKMLVFRWIRANKPIAGLLRSLPARVSGEIKDELIGILRNVEAKRGLTVSKDRDTLYAEAYINAVLNKPIKSGKPKFRK